MTGRLPGQICHPWQPWQIAKLREMWPDPANTLVKIGQALGRSKSSVNGMSGRLGLAGRPSPIQPKGTGKPANPRRAPSQTLPPTTDPAIPVATLPVERSSISGRMSPMSFRRGDDAVRGATLSTTPAPAAEPLRQDLRTRTCCWPIGDPGTKVFRFCEDAAEPRKPYCALHCAAAYVHPPRIGPPQDRQQTMGQA